MFPQSYKLLQSNDRNKVTNANNENHIIIHLIALGRKFVMSRTKPWRRKRGRKQEASKENFTCSSSTHENRKAI